MSGLGTPVASRPYDDAVPRFDTSEGLAVGPVNGTAARTRMQTWLVAAIVAIAFADSSIVVLALPQLYKRFETSITGVSWVVTSYNAALAAVAAAGLVAVARRKDEPTAVEGWRPSLRRTVPANVCLGLVFGALVGALFLGVLLVIVVWQYTPIEGALIVSVLPLGALAARALPRNAAAGAALLGAGLVALALLPSAGVPIAICALALCGVRLGRAVPTLSNAALDPEAGLTRSGTLTIGVRHLGLVAAIATIAPLLAGTLPDAGDRAMLKATQVLLDAPIGITDKVPIALDLRKAFNKAKAGEIPNLKEPFDSRGARSDAKLAAARDDLVSAIQDTITRAFRSAFFLAAAFAGAGALLAWRLIR